MRLAIVGLGVAGSYLLNRLSREHDVTGYEMQKEGEFQAVCLHPETPIITARGTIPIIEVVEGDFVMTHRGRFRKVLRSFRRLYSGDLIKITPKYTNIPIRLTPEHPIRISRKKTLWTGSYEWISAGELRNFEGIRLCVPSIAKSSVSKSPINPRLIGYYLAEGSLGKDEVYFYFNRVGEQEYVNETVTLLKREGFNPRVQHRDTSCAVVVYSLKLATILSQFGERAYNKKLPSYMLTLDLEEAKDLLLCLFRGDGCYTKDGITLSTSSISLASQVQLLLRRFGILASIRKEREAGGDFSTIDGRVLQRVHSTFRIDINGNVDSLLEAFGDEKIRSYSWSYASWMPRSNNFLVPISKYEIEPYTGYVFNLEIEEDNSYQTIIGTLHNCAWGTSKNELRKFMKPLGIDFDKYILFDGKEMVVDVGKGNFRKIPLIGLVTYDKHQLEVDLTKGKKAKFGVKVTPSSLKDENYDMIIDCTSIHRAFLPKVREDLWVPCVEYRMDYGKEGTPHKDFFIQPFQGLSGYFWYFPLEDGLAYVGAGDFQKRHNEFLDRFNAENPGKVLKKIGRPIRISPPKYCEPFYIGNVVGCGESIGTVFPLLGEGIIPSLQCADLLCENLNDLPAYRKAVLEKFEYFNYVYDIIKLKFEGKFSMVKHLPLLLKTYREMKRTEERFGLEVHLGDFKEIISNF